jgi:hypothetical protein
MAHFPWTTLPTDVTIAGRSYWIPGSYAPALSAKRNAFFRLLKNKGFKEERRTKVGMNALGSSTTLESNKSQTPMALLKAIGKESMAILSVEKNTGVSLPINFDANCDKWTKSSLA